MEAEAEAELLQESKCVTRKAMIAEDHLQEVTVEAGAALLANIITRTDTTTMVESNKDTTNRRVHTPQEVDLDLQYLTIITNKTAEVTQDHHLPLLPLLPLLNHQRESTR